MKRLKVNMSEWLQSGREVNPSHWMQLQIRGGDGSRVRRAKGGRVRSLVNEKGCAKASKRNTIVRLRMTICGLTLIHSLL